MKSIESREIPSIILGILICQSAGIIGSYFTGTSVSSWYQTLAKPSFTPPGWIIGAVWIFLFTLMGVSIFLVWRERKSRSEASTALNIFAFQLIVNVLWSFAFFGMRSLVAGFVVIIILWILILMTLAKFLPISRTAAFLWFPTYYG